jgi:uncharacterized membrane protein
MGIPPRFTGLLALLGLVPITAYLSISGQADVTSSVLSAVNVVIITGSLFLLFGPSEAEQSHGTGG